MEATSRQTDLGEFRSTSRLGLVALFLASKKWPSPEVFRWREVGMKGQVSEALEPGFFLGGGSAIRDILKIILQVYNLIYQTYKK